MKIKKGDVVKILSGNDRGLTGRVIKAIPKKSRVIVEGVNVMTKHIRPTQDNPQGGIIHQEGSIHISNVALIVDGNASRVGYKILENTTEKHKRKVRISKRNNEIINK